MTDDSAVREDEQLDREAGSEGGNKPASRSKAASFVMGIVVVALLGGGGVAGYGWMQVKKLSQDDFVLKIADAFKFPIAKINGLSVPYAEYVQDMSVLNKFYENPPEGVPTPTAEELSDQVLARLVANRLVGAIADEFAVAVTKEDVDAAKSDLLAQFPDASAAEKELNDKYGWSIDTYAAKVIYPLLREQKLQAVFETSDDERAKEFQKEEIRARHILFVVGEDDDEETIKAKAQSVLERIQGGEDFATLAGEFGEDGTKERGGDLGWFGRGKMVAEFEEAVFALEAGALGPELVRSPFGFHIVRVDEKRTVNDFIAFMDKQLRDAKIDVVLPVHNPFENLSADLEDTDNADEAGRE